ncbi:MAG: hypothetical protein GW778_05330 [Alphaproteobacteria bacterium]|nr:hypothetical protein [Alphaproteobacteria bacterium]
MRVFLVIVVMALSLFVSHGIAFAQDNTHTPRRSVSDYFGGAQKYILGDSAGDVREPYLKDGKGPQNNQWDHDAWSPELWAEDKGSVMAVIDGFYDAGILVRQYEDKVPVLEVGKPFLKLSPIDQRHVVEFIDYAFKITADQKPGVFYIVIDQKAGKRLLGLYSIHGLQMQ